MPTVDVIAELHGADEVKYYCSMCKAASCSSRWSFKRNLTKQRSRYIFR